MDNITPIPALAVGQQRPALARYGEGVVFDVTDTGAELTYIFHAPTAAEIKAVSEKQRFEIRFTVVRDILFILTKCGNLAWTDAPYHPRLSPQLSEIPCIPDGQGLLLLLMMADQRDCVIKSLRAISLGTKFSRDLLEEIKRLRAQPFSVREYNQALADVMRSYPTSALVRMSSHYFKTGGDHEEQ